MKLKKERLTKNQRFCNPAILPRTTFLLALEIYFGHIFFIKMEYQKNTFTLTTISYRRLLFGYYSACR